jgi:hypothetical protein
MVSHKCFQVVLVVFAFLTLAVSAPAWAKGPPPGKGPGGGGDTETTLDQKSLQPRPITLGVSGGSAHAIANGYCCGGTLGSLVAIGSTQYILSNAHVFAGDTVLGGNNQISTSGDWIVQPGLIDNQCSATTNGQSNTVAALSNWAALDGNDNVDAAIAQVANGAVDSSGEIYGIGVIANTTAAAFVGQEVKKTGRTSGFTRGSVKALNATVSVGYSDECAGGSFTKTFTGQIIVGPGKFLKSGDSGSLMVEDVNDTPRAVGLLFAGSKRVAVANPIDDVLDYFGASMVGGAASATSSATSTSASSSAGKGQAMASAKRLQKEHGPQLLQIPGVQGHALGLSKNGRVVIKLLVDRATARLARSAPREIDGVSVELWEVGKITAY